MSVQGIGATHTTFLRSPLRPFFFFFFFIDVFRRILRSIPTSASRAFSDHSEKV